MLKNKLIALFQQILAEFAIELFIEFFIEKRGIPHPNHVLGGDG